MWPSTVAKRTTWYLSTQQNAFALARRFGDCCRSYRFRMITHMFLLVLVEESLLGHQITFFHRSALARTPEFVLMFISYVRRALRMRIGYRCIGVARISLTECTCFWRCQNEVHKMASGPSMQSLYLLKLQLEMMIVVQIYRSRWRRWRPESKFVVQIGQHWRHMLLPR